MLFIKSLKIMPFTLFTLLLVEGQPTIVAPVNSSTPTVVLASKPKRPARVIFRPRKNQKAPGWTVGGGRRNDNQCPVAGAPANTQNKQVPLIALVPKDGPGITLAPYPSILVYVPSTSARAVELTLKDDQDNGLYQKMFDLPAKPGVVSFPLPTTEAALEVGKTYKWILTLVCDPAGARPEDPYVEGGIQRIQLDAVTIKEMDAANGVDQITLYAQEGIWHEALSQLVRLQQSQPDNAQLASIWQEFLQAAGLEALSNVLLPTK